MFKIQGKKTDNVCIPQCYLGISTFIHDKMFDSVLKKKAFTTQWSKGGHQCKEFDKKHSFSQIFNHIFGQTEKLYLPIPYLFNPDHSTHTYTDFISSVEATMSLRM